MLIIEGIDGVGKTTLSNQLENDGFIKYHFDYDEETDDLFEKYNNVLLKNINDLNKMVFDRSFISEMVYGPVLRGKSRLSEDEFKNLLISYHEQGCKIVFMTASKETLLSRREDDSNDLLIINEYYEQQNDQYRKVMELSKTYIEMIMLDTNDIPIESMENIIKEKYINENRSVIYGEHIFR